MRNSLLAITLLAMSGLVSATELTINFEQPEKFTDIRPANDSKSRYQQRVTAAFERFFNEQAAKMPEGYRWDITITDIDLAGDVDYFAGPTGQALRIVKDIYSPAVRFTHTLRDNLGEEVLSGEVRLRDMGFMQRLSSSSSRPEFEFENKMIEDWFKKAVQPAITQHAAVPPKVSQ